MKATVKMPHHANIKVTMGKFKQCHVNHICAQRVHALDRVLLTTGMVATLGDAQVIRKAVSVLRTLNLRLELVTRTKKF